MSNFAKYIKTRMKNYGFWVSLFALIPLAFQTFGNVNLLPTNYEEIVKLVLGLIVALGIASNPTTENKGYLDDK